MTLDIVKDLNGEVPSFKGNVFQAAKCTSFTECKDWDLKGEYHSFTNG